MRSGAVLFLLSAALINANIHQNDTCRFATGNIGLSTPIIDSASSTFRVFSDIRIQSACPHWTADVFVNDQLKVSLDICSCDAASVHSISCHVPLDTSDFSPEISVEVILRKSDACGSDGAWIRARSTAQLPSQVAAASSSVDDLDEIHRAQSRGSAQMDLLCSNLEPPRTFDGQNLPDLSVPVLVASADSLIPQSVTSLLNLLQSMAEHAPEQQLVLCDVGLTSWNRNELMEKIQAVTSAALRKHVSVIRPPWESAFLFKTPGHFSRVLNFRSACLAAVFCKHETAMWVDSDLTLRGSIDESLQELSNDGYWLMSNNPEPLASAFPSNVSVSRLGFSRSGGHEAGAAFEAVFLPLFGEALAEVDVYAAVWDGGVLQEKQEKQVVLDMRERTVAGSLEMRILGKMVRATQRSGLKVVVRACMKEHATRGKHGREGQGGCAGEEEEASLGELMKVSRTDKLFLHSYDRYYAKRFESMRHKQGVRVLELGGAEGNSLDVWLSYFSAPAAVHVLTLFKQESGRQGSKEWACQLHPEKCGAVRFFIGDQGDEEMMEAVLRDGARLEPAGAPPHALDIFWSTMGGYDIIIDDAAHYPPLQIFSLARLLPAVRPGGCYIVEDLETSYWNAKPTPRIYGRNIHGAGVGQPAPGNAVAKLKELVEVLFRWHMGMDNSLTVLGEDSDNHLFALTFGAGLAILDRATVEEGIHTPRVGILRRPYMQNFVDAAAVARWADEVRETNPF